MKTGFFLPLALLSIAACGGSQPPVTLDSSDSSVIPAEAVASKLGEASPEQPQTPLPAPALPVLGDAVFSITPGHFFPCQTPNGAVIATARWNVVPLGVEQVSIFVESPGNPRKLWVEGGAEGESVTGQWVFDQTRFSMVQRDTDRLLAERTVMAVACG